jgi:ketosteroid isomerase-like protein
MSLKETVQEWCNRYAAVLIGGAKGSGAFFAEDANLLPPGPDNIKGPAAIEAFWVAAAEHFTNVRLTTIDAAQLSPDFIREIGTYYAEPKVQGGTVLSGKYVFVWRKVGGDWKIWTDIWTSHSGQT